MNRIMRFPSKNMISRLLLIILCLSGALYAQISPGDLASAHAQLEGVDKCNSCHTLGKVLSNENCLKCHSEINSRIQKHTGFHTSIGSKQCSECHKDHHGRNFQMIRFDTKAFDHTAVGFTLEGKHLQLACRSCHTKQKISSGDITALSESRKEKTYLGLQRTCSPCHADKHKGQLKSDCNQCHTVTQWKPAVKFNHDQAKYPLTGKHTSVNCYQCHSRKLNDGVTVQFVKMNFQDCNACHTDPHKGRMNQRCSVCHTTDDFHKVNKGQFDHATTKFPLQGKHASVQCVQCHPASKNAKNASGETGFHITQFQACSDCHQDAHAQQLVKRKDGGACESCHSVDGFLPVRFSVHDHEQTRLPLESGHVRVACVKCHAAGKVIAKSTRQLHWDGAMDCRYCHTDIHQGQFNNRVKNGCVTCHSATIWKTLKFDHAGSRFPLSGKHASIACKECHTVQADTTQAVRFAGLSVNCFSCHKDEHEGQLAVNGVTHCERCHDTKLWKSTRFEHNLQSRYFLDGRHVTLACDRCHSSEVINNRRVIRYKPKGVTCSGCHSQKQ